MTDKTCCFFGHREVSCAEEVSARVYGIIERLIKDAGITVFLFGSKSRFNSLCYECVTEMRKKYPFIRRVFVRAEYPDIGSDYREYLSERYEDTYFPERIRGAGKAAYIERNCEMIDKSRICVVYYNRADSSRTRKSGTEIAFNYAVRRKKEIINTAVLP